MGEQLHQARPSASPTSATLPGALDFEAMRRAMVASQLRTSAVSDPRVVAAMAAVPRERFVPSDCAALAYADRPVPLGGGRMLNPPMATGRLLTEAAPAAGAHALLIGAGTGYAAAVLARLVGSVVALEEDPALVEAARLALAGLAGVELVQGPLITGWLPRAPYDLIVIDGAIDALPSAYADQLCDGGTLVAGLIEDGIARLIVGRRGGGGFGMTAFADAECARLPGFAPAPGFAF